MTSRYQVTAPGNASPEMQEMSTQINGVLNRVRTDMKIARFKRVDLPMDDSERIAIVTDDAPPSLNFFDPVSGWQKLAV